MRVTIFVNRIFADKGRMRSFVWTLGNLQKERCGHRYLQRADNKGTKGKTATYKPMNPQGY